MDSNKSNFLHLLRWTSSIIVIIGHSQLIGNNNNLIFKYLGAHAHAAVIIFFVLSGYVIAFSVDKKKSLPYGFTEYIIDRFSRIYSVLIPVLLLTFSIDLIGRNYLSSRYLDSSLVPQTNILFRFLVNLFSVQGIWGYRVQFGSNPALWSIGYEFIYYVLFGLLFFKPKNYLLVLLIASIFIGPKVILYSSIWALGVVAFYVNKKHETFTFNFFLSLFFLIIANHYFEFKAFPKAFHEFFRDFLFALCVMLLLLSKTPKIPNSFLKLNLFMSEFSYTLYATHYPIMFLLFSLAKPTLAFSLVTIVVSIIFGRLFYYISEYRRNNLRKMIRRFYKHHCLTTH